MRCSHAGLAIGCGLIAATLGGCGTGEPSQPAIERTDVDGVEVVTSREPTWPDAEAWRLAPEPEIVIGEDERDPRYLFSDVVGAVRLVDGSIVVGDRQTNGLRYFDAVGELVRAVGGTGEAPGEFLRLDEVHECGRDTIYARDGARDEINVFDAAGRFLGRHPFEANADARIYTGLSCNAEGRLLAMDWGNEFDDGVHEIGYYRTTVHLYLLEPEGFVVQDLGAFPGVDRLGRAGGSAPHPIGKTPARILGDEHVYIGTADEFEVEVRSLDGELIRRLRRPVEPASITGNEIDRYIEFATRHASEAAARRLRDSVDAENSAATFPAYSRFLLDASGHLWVENYRPPWEEAEPRRWSVFDPEGVWLGDVEAPPTFEITDVGDDHVLGVFRDELDQESVRLYPLSRGSG